LILQKEIAYSAGNFYIKGKIIHRESDTEWSHTVYLSKMSSIDDFFKCSPSLVVDSAPIGKNGAFKFKNNKGIEPNSFYRLEVVHNGCKGGSMMIFSGTSDNFAFLLLNPVSQIEFSTELAKFNYALHPIRMDPANLAMRHIYDLTRSTNEAIEKIVVHRSRLEVDTATTPDSLKYLRAKSNELGEKHAREMMPVIDTIRNPLVSLFAFITNFSDDSVFCVKMNERYQREIPKSKYAGQFLEMIYDIFYTLPVGSQAPDIALPDSSGKMMSTADLRGRYLLVDFWGSWCHPCRVENQEVIKPLYAKYGSRNFFILSISLDTDRDTWLRALQKDKLNWPGEVCDFKGVKSGAAMAYKLTDLPVIYVLGPDGTILAKNLHGKELEDFINNKMK
jgi:thiol-disulfide isomerase/thioredoxin